MGHQVDGKSLHRRLRAIHVFVRKPFHHSYVQALYCGKKEGVAAEAFPTAGTRVPPT